MLQRAAGERQVDRWSDGERRSARWRAGRGEMALAWEEREGEEQV